VTAIAKIIPEVWARVNPQGAHVLRRGAWYRLMREPRDGIVLLDVNKEIVPIGEQFVTLVDHKPAKWSVVSRDPADYGARRASMERHLDATYAVCPACRTRTNVEHTSQSRRCPNCGGLYAVDWGELC
jgi:hypothetical protein